MGHLEERKLPLTPAARLEPSRCALIVVDMQNDFCAPGGYLSRTLGKDVSAAADILPRINALVTQARAADVPVVWLRADYSHDRIPDPMAARLALRGSHVECCKPGTWGFEWFGVEPAPEEPIVTKHGYSGFVNTTMQSVLEPLGRKTLILVGTQTQVCVEATLRDAYAHGYFCVAVENAVGSHTQALHEASLNTVRTLFGDVCKTSEVAAAWRSETSD